MTVLADSPVRGVLEVRVRYALGFLVSIAAIVRYTDGSQYNCGLYSMPLQDWHRILRPLLLEGVKNGTVTLDDDTVPNNAAT